MNRVSSKISVHTFGCKVNQFDASAYEASLRSGGLRLAGCSDGDDVHVIFGCSVTESASRQARQLMRRIRRERPDAKIFVAGCYAKLFPNEIEDDGAIILPDSGEEFPAVQDRGRAYLKIQDGCSYSCNYCIIRVARGESRSVAPSAVIEQAQRLRESGFSEIVLCGIHIGIYGNDFEKPYPLSTLLEKLFESVEGVRFRLSSMHPHEIDGRLIEMWGDKKLCRHLHLSIQSGDDELLKAMGRRPARSRIEDVVRRIHAKDEGTFFAADLIVGYPGETDEQHGSTLSMVKTLPFSWLHAFPFSPRPDTPAENLKMLPANVVKERMSPLLELADERRKAFSKMHVGRKLDALVISQEIGDNVRVRAVSDNNIEMNLPGGVSYRSICEAVGESVKGKILWGNWK